MMGVFSVCLVFTLEVIRYIAPPVYVLIFWNVFRSPGLPVRNPSSSYWMSPPSPIATHGSENNLGLPEYADIVIIGSGIAGTSFARTLLDYDATHNMTDSRLQVVMLEARETCSGATGRNGGHVSPVLYSEYVGFKKALGPEMAKKIIQFRLSHLRQLLTIAQEEDLLEDSQCREVEAFDVFHDKNLFQRAKTELEIYKNDLPSESAHYRVYEGDAIEALQLSSSTAGCISTIGGAIHPYRMVTGILSRLLTSYPSNFHLFTHLPCTAISEPIKSSSSPQLYTVSTPKGTIKTAHIVHATNAWVTNLLPRMRPKIFPARATMTTQAPHFASSDMSSLANLSRTGSRSFVFYPDDSYYVFDYLTQQPLPDTKSTWKAPSTFPPPSGEFMFGGGFMQNAGFFKEIGVTDDHSWKPAVVNYLARTLNKYFKRDVATPKTQWSGLIGLSVDGFPWVGRIPPVVADRRPPPPVSPCANDSNSCAAAQLALPGEWIVAGFSGEGMTHAWLSGKSLAYMMLGLENSQDANGQKPLNAMNEENGPDHLDTWFPQVFRITEERWKNGDFGNFVRSMLLV